MRPNLAILMTLAVVLQFRQVSYGQSPAANAAKARQDVVKTLVAELRFKQFVVKGGASRQIPMELAGKAVPFPAEDTTFESLNRLVIDGEKVRYERNHPRWHADGFLVKKAILNVCDGNISKQFFPQGVGTQDTMQGLIKKDAVAEMVNLSELAPLVFNVRGLSPNICSYNVKALKQTGQSLPIEGTPCEEYIYRYNKQSAVHFWFDPERDYVVRRISHSESGRIRSQTDVQYHITNMIWVPKSWVISNFEEDGSLLESLEIVVLDLQTSTTIPDSQFDIKFPAGCLVQDQRPTRVINYRVQADGSMREVGPSGDDLPDGKVVLQSDMSWFRRNQWILIGCAISFFLFLVLLYRRRHANHQMP